VSKNNGFPIEFYIKNSTRNSPKGKTDGRFTPQRLPGRHPERGVAAAEDPGSLDKDIKKAPGLP
jgi:hypothetical protein